MWQIICDFNFYFLFLTYAMVIGCCITTTVFLLPQTLEQPIPDATHAEIGWSKLMRNTNTNIIVHVVVRPGNVKAAITTNP